MTLRWTRSGREVILWSSAQALRECSNAWLLLALLVGTIPLPAQTASVNPSERDVVLEGKGMFQQRCAVCHLPLVVDDDRTYGPTLSAETVNGREAIIREFIRRGTPRMPGFQYGLRAEEIDSIIEYLKTVPKAESE